MTKRPPNRKPIAIDLFCGCGGLSLGLEKAGFHVAVAVEMERLAALTYAKNHSNTVIIHRDILDVTSADLRRASGIKRGDLDLLAGCPPCQGFSRLKEKCTHEDPRNDLVFKFTELLADLKPKMILLENVPGLQNDYRFYFLLSVLDELGYQFDWAILNAADFNVPQRRRRLILMASRLGQITVPRPPRSHRTVRETIGKLVPPDRSRDPLHQMYMRSGDRILDMIRRVPRNGGSREALGEDAQLQCHRTTDGYHDIYGRMSWNDVAPTLTSGCYNPSKGRFLHPSQNRPISLREAALLQTFPMHYRFPQGAGLIRVARLIGDALPPKFAEKQARHIMKHLRNACQ